MIQAPDDPVVQNHRKQKILFWSNSYIFYSVKSVGLFILYDILHALLHIN